jgi:hypothetical protein
MPARCGHRLFLEAITQACTEGPRPRDIAIREDVLEDLRPALGRGKNVAAIPARAQAALAAGAGTVPGAVVVAWAQAVVVAWQQSAVEQHSINAVREDQRVCRLTPVFISLPPPNALGCSAR